MDIQNLIPKHKHDHEATTELKNLSIDELKPIIPQLFEWTEDMNWPVAKEISKILINCGKEILPEVRKTLNNGDEDWKYFCLAYIVYELPIEIIKNLKSDLEQIAYNPSEYQKFFELNVIEAKKILELIK